MKKRILTVLLAVCLVFALGTVSALATDDPASTEDIVYTTLPAADSDGVIKLDKDVVLKTSAVIEGSIVLDLNGHSITASDNWPSQDNTYDYLIGVKRGATLTVKDSASGGIIDATNSNANKLAVAIKLTLKGEGETGSVASLIVESGIIKGTSYGISGNGTRHNTSLSISGGQVVATNGAGIYHPQDGEMTIYGGNITGLNTAVEIRSGKLTISGGNFTSTASTYSATPNGDGTTVSGAAIAVSQHTTDMDIYVTITGGTFTGPRAFSETNVQNQDSTENVTVKISDGTFNGEVYSDDCTEFITGGRFTDTNNEGFEAYLAPGLEIGENGKVEISDDAVAKVGDTVYTDLQEAINAANAGDEVELLKDVPLTAGLTISENITIDGGNYDLTISDVTGDGIKITSGHTLKLANTDLKITGKTNNAGNFDGTGINAVGSLTLENSDVVLEDLNKAIIANADNNEIKLEDSTLTIDDIDGNASNGGKWTVDDSTVNISDVGNYGLSVYSLKTTGASKLSFENIGYGAIFAELSIDIGGTTSVKIDNAGSDNKDNTIIFESPYGDCYAPIQLVVDKKGLPTSGREITFGSGTSISVVDSFDHNGDVYVDKGTKYVNNSGDYLSVKIVGNDVFMVTFVDDDDDFLFSYTVVENEDITLPGRPYYSAREFIGWLCDEDHKIYEARDEYENVDGNLEFKAVWEAAAYDIVIDDDILHGDIWTSPKSEAEAGDTVHVYADPDAGYVLEDLSVTYRSGRNELKLTRVSANHYTFTMPARDVYVTAEFTSDGFPFDDVRSNQWFYDAVYYVWANDLMEGVDYDEFNPNGTMTRAMFWAVLGRIDGETITGTNWADEARDWAMSEGVSDGTNPNGLVTREQMVTMLWRYAGERDGSGNLSRYTDGDKVAQYATEAMRWALGNGIIEGTTATTLEPQATATRAQCAAIFMRYYE